MKYLYSVMLVLIAFCDVAFSCNTGIKTCDRRDGWGHNYEQGIPVERINYKCEGAVESLLNAANGHFNTTSYANIEGDYIYWTDAEGCEVRCPFDFYDYHETPPRLENVGLPQPGVKKLHTESEVTALLESLKEDQLAIEGPIIEEGIKKDTESPAYLKYFYVYVIVDTGCRWYESRYYFTLEDFLCDDGDDTDSDGDGLPDCIDGCPSDPNKTAPGQCDCGVSDTDTDGDGSANCNDGCPTDPNKTSEGTCGCNRSDIDNDHDGKPDCNDTENGEDGPGGGPLLGSGPGSGGGGGSCPTDDGSKHGNPIRIYNGNKIESMTDLAFKTPFAGGLGLRRYYNSYSIFNSPVGFGWTHSYNIALNDELNFGTDVVKILDNTGRGIYFRYNGLNYEGESGEKSWLERSGDFYIWHNTDDITYTFDQAGKLLTLADKNSNIQTLSYNNQNYLETVTDNATGRTLTFAYDAGFRITHITGPVTDAVADGIWVSYGYDNNDNLTHVTYADGSGYEYLYEDTNDPNNMTEKRDAEGHMISMWSYDNQDRAFSSVNREGKNAFIEYVNPTTVNVTDAHGVKKTYSIATINGRKKVTNVTAGNGCASCGSGVVRYGYDDQRNLTEKEYVGGRIDRYENYDDNGHAQTVITGYGSLDQRTVYYTYHPEIDATLSRSEVSLLGGGTTSTIWDYDNDGNDTPNEDPTLRVYRKIEQGYTHDSTGAVVPFTYVTRYTYNHRGQITSEDGPLPGDSDETVFIYDPQTFDLTEIINPVTGSTVFGHDAAGNITSTTDTNGVVTVNDFDGRNRPVESVTNGRTTRSTYTPSGDIETRTDAENRTSTYQYESETGRLEKVADPMGNYHLYQHDDLGHVTSDSIYSSADDLARTLRFNFNGPDKSGKLYRQINSDETYTEFGYDASGNRITEKSPDGKITSTTYDTLNRVQTVTQPGGVVTSYDYDVKGNLTQVTDAKGLATVYSYDDLGRLVKTVSPDTGTTRYAYTPAGKLHTKTLNNGQTTTYDYDSLGRLTHIHYPDSTEDETYTYDQGINGKGRLTGRSGKGWTSVYEYNAVGQITSETRTVSGATFITRYTYDKSGVLTAMTYPDGRTVTYAPNPNGQPLSAVTAKSGTGKTLAEGAAYKPFGPLSGFDMGNGMEVRKTFDQDYRLKTLAAGSVMNLSYIHYMNGMIREITNALDPARSQFFTYDDLGRLKTANGVYGRMAWTYDNVGNRLTESRNGITESYAYKTGTNIIESVDGALDKTFVHDANGNIHHAVIQKTSAAAQVTSDYLYTSDGLRLTRSSNGLTTVYHYDLAGNLIGESGPDGGNFKAHVYFAGTRLATVAADGTVCYHHNNHLETPVMMTDDDGDVVWRADYKPFGKAEVASSSSVVNDFRFPGQVFDAETGYHYNWNRYYDSETGRYLTADPIGLDGGINLYSYTSGNPTNLVDPKGLFTGVEESIGIYIVGGAIISGIAYYGNQVAADVGQWIGEAYNEARRGRSQNPTRENYPDIPNVKCNGKCPPCPDVNFYMLHFHPLDGYPGIKAHYHRWSYQQDKNCTCRFKQDTDHYLL